MSSETSTELQDKKSKALCGTIAALSHNGYKEKHNHEVKIATLGDLLVSRFRSALASRTVSLVGFMSRTNRQSSLLKMWMVSFASYIWQRRSLLPNVPSRLFHAAYFDYALDIPDHGWQATAMPYAANCQEP